MSKTYVNIDGRSVGLDEDDYADYLDYMSGNGNRSWGAYVDDGDVLDVGRYLDMNDIRNSVREGKRRKRDAFYSRYDYPELSAVSSVQRSDWDDEDYQDEVELKNLIGSIRPGVRKAIGKAVEFAGKFYDPLFGKENEDYNGGEDVFDEIPTAAYVAAPFINPALGIGLYGASVINDVYKGKKTPGILDAAIVGGLGKGVVKGAGRLAKGVRSGSKAFADSYKAARAARKAEMARTLPGEKYVQPPKYRLFDRDGNEIMSNEGHWYSSWK